MIKVKLKFITYLEFERNQTFVNNRTITSNSPIIIVVTKQALREQDERIQWRGGHRMKRNDRIKGSLVQNNLDHRSLHTRKDHCLLF